MGLNRDRNRLESRWRMARRGRSLGPAHRQEPVREPAVVPFRACPVVAAEAGPGLAADLDALPAEETGRGFAASLDALPMGEPGTGFAADLGARRAALALGSSARS